MASKTSKEEQKTQDQAKPFSDKHRNLLMVGVVGALMLLEGMGLVVAVRYLGMGPATAAATDETTSGEGTDGPAWLPPEIEVPVTDLVAFNSQNGRVYVYQLSVCAAIDGKHGQRIKDLLEARRNTIDDRLSKVIRAADPKYLNEAGLETLRRQFKHELDEIVGDENLIKEILFPEFSKSRAD